MEVNILGSDWTVKFLTDKQWKREKTLGKEHRKSKEYDGLCLGYQRVIIVKKDLEEKQRNAVLRHEIVHAFQYETGVMYAMDNCWNTESETEWIAHNLHKISEVFEKLNI